VVEVTFQAKEQHVCVHARQINTTCDDEDKDKDEPADWSIAVDRSTKGGSSETDYERFSGTPL
jgi:hypothetical protein